MRGGVCVCVCVCVCVLWRCGSLGPVHARTHRRGVVQGVAGLEVREGLRGLHERDTGVPRAVHVEAVWEERLEDVGPGHHVAVEHEDVLPPRGRRRMEERVVQVPRLGVVRLPGLADPVFCWCGVWGG